MSERQSSIGPQQAFQMHLAEGRFMLQRSVQTGAWIYYPRSVAPVTGEELEWAEHSGLGTVYSTTSIRKRPPEPAINVALIDLDEGPRMMSRVEGIDSQDVRIGMRVKAHIVRSGDEDAPHLVVFHPVDNGQ
jgi:hypothetical protein